MTARLVSSNTCYKLMRYPLSKEPCSILIVDDEPYILATLSSMLNGEFEVLTAANSAEAKEIFTKRQVDVILSDQRMPGEPGVELLKWVYENAPRTIRLLMTGFAEIEDAVEAINHARIFSYIFKPWKPQELLELLQRAAYTFRLERDNKQLISELTSLNEDLEKRVFRRTQELIETNHELEQKNRMLEKLALTDPLTNLPNRRAMDRLVERELRRRARYPNPTAVGLLDIDHFKQVNSKYLLPGGDRVLIDFTKCVANSLRTVDTLGRIGGEEFLVLAPETDTEGAETLAERMRSTVENTPFYYKNHEIHVTVSIGFAVADPNLNADFDRMKHTASAALAEAKMTGRNRCVVYSLDQKPIEQAV